MTVRHPWNPWRSLANRSDLATHLQIGRARAAVGRTRRDWLALGAAAGTASSRRLSAARKSLGRAARAARATGAKRRSNGTSSPADQPQLSAGQRRTLETGSCVVLSGLGVGVQFGSWPAWTILAGVGIYLAWVLLYAEVTVQAKRRPNLWQRWRWRGRPRLRGRPRIARVDSLVRAGVLARFGRRRSGRRPGDGTSGGFSPAPMIDPGQPTTGRTHNLAAGECPTPLGRDLPIGARAVKS